MTSMKALDVQSEPGLQMNRQVILGEEMDIVLVKPEPNRLVLPVRLAAFVVYHQRSQVFATDIATPTFG